MKDNFDRITDLIVIAAVLITAVIVFITIRILGGNFNG